jgi:hypothetical protein
MKLLPPKTFLKIKRDCFNKISINYTVTTKRNDMRITHPTTHKEQNVKDLKVIVDEDVKCVEFTVIGNSSEWRDAATYNAFHEANPSIVLDD